MIRQRLVTILSFLFCYVLLSFAGFEFVEGGCLVGIIRIHNKPFHISEHGNSVLLTFIKVACSPFA